MKRLIADVTTPGGVIKDPTGFIFAGKTPAYILQQLLDFVFVGAGILLFLFLITGGIELMISAGDPKKMEAGKEKITQALIGLIIVFSSVFIYRIIQYTFGIII